MKKYIAKGVRMICVPVHGIGTSHKQEVSSKKIIVESNRAVLSLKKDIGIVKESKWPDDVAALTQEGPKCRKNCVETTKIWDQNDSNRMIRVRDGLRVFW